MFFGYRERVMIVGTGHNEQEQRATTATSSDTMPAIALKGSTEAQIIAPMVIPGNNNTVNINSPPSPTPSQERIEFNVQECVPSFFGRDDFINKLHEDISLGQTENSSPIRAKAIVICGLAGVGKTQAVRRYIQKYKESYHHVLWINAERNSGAMSNFFGLAAIISIVSNHNGRQNPDLEILDEIYSFVCRKPTLIVYDNVGSFKSDDGKEGLHLLLPQALKTGWKVPAIIITTRNRDWQHFTFRELTGFDLSESLSFLSALKFEDTEDNRHLLQKVTTMCQGLPLALQQVISFIQIKRDKRAAVSERPYILMDFLTDVTSKKTKKFISTKPPELASLDVYTLFDLTFEQISSMEYGELAIQCLDVMSVLNPDCIPTVLIKQVFSHLKSKLAKALTLLHKYTLVTRFDTYYQIHRMVQSAKLESSKQNCSSYVKQNLNAILGSLTPFLITLPTNSENVHEILNNSKRFLDQAEELQSKPLLKFQDCLVYQLENVGSYRNAIELQRKNLQSNANFWESYDLKTIESKATLSRLLFKQALYDEAEELYNDVLKMTINILGPDHPTTLTTKNNLALVFQSQGKYDEAEELYNDVLKMAINILGPDHPTTLTIKNNLADIFNSQGKYDEAEELYNDVLKTTINMLGPDSPDHPTTLTTKNNLALLYKSQGKYDEAEELYNDVLKMRINILGPDHPNTLTTKNNLASVFNSQEKYDEAEELYNDVLKMRINILGPDHPNTLTTKNNLALVFQSQGKYDEAEVLYNDVLKMRINILGHDHGDTLTTKNNLADVYNSQGKYDAAEELYNDVLKMAINILGPDHPTTLTIQNNLIAVFESRKINDEAEELYNDVLKMEINQSKS